MENKVKTIRVRILITNDDGLHFPGILSLKKILSKKHEIYTFGPQIEKSATSQAMTLYDDIYVKKVDHNTYIVNGYPVDCVNVALHSGLVKNNFDLLVSGINKGVNMGEDVLYSGTVGAARHGFIHGIPSIAVSSGYLDSAGDFDSIAYFLLQFIEDHSAELKAPVLWNMNIPVNITLNKISSIIKWTKLGSRIYRDSYKRTTLEDGAFPPLIYQASKQIAVL